MPEISERIAALSPKKREMLLRQLERAKSREEDHSIRPQDRRSNRFPLSFAQKRFWFLDQMEPGNPASHMPGGLVLKGDLNVSVLIASFNALIERHESLRTKFTSDAGEPLQAVHAPTPLNVPIIDLAHVPLESREEEVQRLALEEAARPFDLASGPHIRITLLRVQPDRHVLLLTLHHIVSDAWSMRVLFGELAVLYSAFCANSVNGGASSNPLPPLELQYIDFAVWQRAWLQGEVSERQLSYWRQRLSGLPESLDLPTDFPRPPRLSQKGQVVSAVLPSSLADRLKALSQAHGATLFMTLLAIFKALLFKYTGQQDIVVGTPVANRTRADIEGIIGFFVNSLVLRTGLSGDLQFSTLLRQVAHASLEAFDHQDLPFDRLVEELQPERSLNRHPLFQVLFQLQSNLLPPMVLPGLKVEPLVVSTWATGFDLNVWFVEREGELAVWMLYSADLFQESTVARMLEHFRTLAERVLDAPDAQLFRLSLLSESERSKVLLEWNRTERAYPQGCLHTFFEEQVKKTPDLMAVEAGGRGFTYRQLNQRSNQLARYLKELGVGPESLVGLYVERSPEMIVGLLGILKAGGAYLPLDPGYPKERLHYMLEDSGAAVLLTQSSLSGQLSFAGTTVVLDEGVDYDRIVCQGESNLREVVSPENLAYLIYTSGSTGKPKAVMVQHGGACNLPGAQQQMFQVEPGGRVLQFAALGFDASVSEWTMALMNEATLVLGPPKELLVGKELADLLVRQAISHVTLPPSVLATLEVAELSNLATLIVAGESCSKELVKVWSSGRRMLNAYGPTEVTVCATISEPLRDDASLIGRPIANMKVFVLDSSMEPVPAGIAGELYVAGAGLARGYLHQPGLTAQRFVPDPFSADGGRLYRTGDRARWCADGNLEFLGRADEQVKIRGYRIELAEIENALLQHPEVREAVVVVREDESAGKHLVGYVIPRDEKLDTREIRAYLLKWLPEYMVPSKYVELKEFPLTANGKLDRKALPHPQALLEPWQHSVPQNAAEEILCGIWSSVLGVERVSATDNFFELGGHSLLVAKVVSRIRQAFGVELAIRSLFESPTVAALAGRLGEAPQARIALTWQQKPERIPLSYAQQRLWFLYRMEGPSATYNIPLVLRLNGALNVAALEQALGDVVARHESLRTIFPEHEGVPYQRVLSQFEAQPRLSVQAVNVSDLERLLAESASTGLDLKDEAPLRAWLFQTGAEEWTLLLLLHHIAGDDGSMGPLAHDVERAYAARSPRHHGEPPRWGALEVQYTDYTLWQRALLEQGTDETSLMAVQIDFWRKALADLPEELNLPSDRPRPLVGTHRGDRAKLHLDAELYRGLLHLARQCGATLFMVLQAGWAALLNLLGAGHDIPIGTSVAGRGEAALEELVGFFVNTLVLRIDLSGNPTFAELVSRVRSFALEAYQHQDVPFEKLVETLQPGRSLARHPLFQVMLVMHNIPQAHLALPGVQVNYQRIEEKIAKFDLTLNLKENLGPAGELLGIAGELEYSKDLFDSATAEALAERFVRLLQEAVSTPLVRLDELEILSSEERRTLLETWNSTFHAVPAVTLPEWFEKQAASAAELTALVCDGQSVSYSELNERANRLAHHLISLGIGPEARVGIALERSIDLVVALLAVVKSGAAYVPLDPANPPGRLATMMQDASPALVLTASSVEHTLSQGVQVFCLDSPEASVVFDIYPGENPGNQDRVSPLQPENPVYAIYTSGSTGVPKGVVITHAGLINYLAWSSAEYQAEAGAGAPVHTSIGFDLTVTSIFLPLLSGRTVVLVNESGSLDSFSHMLRQGADFSLVKLTPAHVDLLNQRIPIDELAGRARAFVIGGEALSYDALSLWRSHSPQTRLINEYGPTETVVGCSIYEVQPHDPQSGAVPIGKPIANTQLYVLNENLGLVPPKATGELYIGGSGLARGYLGRPDLTAERFIPNPFSGPGARMYRTGDLARWRSDGNLEFLGRADEQVKIRGYRIELAEIETALRDYHEVREAVVMAREDGPAGKYLVAYLAAHSTEGGGKLDLPQLRSYLADKLPEYMIPAHYVELDRLPLTPNGKVDRKALPRPQLGTSAEKQNSPQDATEELLCGIWAEVLGLERVGVHDNFFDLGGHSLLVTKIVSRVRSAFGVELSVTNLFETPTIAGLSVQLRSSGQSKTEAPPVSAVERSSIGEPLSFPQQRLWFLDRLHPEDRSVYNIPLVLRMEGPLDISLLERCFSEIVRRHEALRTTFAARDGEAVQNVEPPPPVMIARFEVPLAPSSKLDTTEDIKGERWETALAMAEEEVRRPFDLAMGPLFRVALFQLHENLNILALTLHHIVSDGWSVGILTRELEELYKAFQSGGPSTLEDLPVQYVDFARWQRTYLQGENIQGHLEYWKGRLADVPALVIPSDRPRPPVQTYTGALASLELSQTLRESIRQFCRVEAVTPFMLLQAGFAVLLRRYTAQTKIAFGSPVANRNRVEIEGLIGLFVNTLVLLVNVEGDPSFRRLLERVRRDSLEALAHEDLPFEVLVDELHGPRDLGASPLFQVMLAMQNAPVSSMSLPGMNLEPLRIDTGTAKFDMLLSLVDFGDDSSLLLEYNTDLFDENTAARILGHLRTLLEEAVKNADRCLSALEFLSPQELRQILIDWNAPGLDVEQDYDRHACIHDLIEAQVLRSPNRVAVNDGHTTLTYLELSRESNKLARYLQTLGVGRESLVGVCLERSAQMIIALLGILKAGGAYVPLDPSHPRERIAFILQDTGLSILIAQAGLLPEAQGVKIVDFSRDREEIERQSASPLNAVSQPDNLAYVIYTSGSTGRPKGVQVCHGAVVNFLCSMRQVPGIAEHDVLLAVTTLSFDIAGLEIYLPLTAGASVKVLAQRAGLDGKQLLREVSNGVTMMQATPATWSLLRDAGWKGAPDFKILCGGEALPFELAQNLTALSGSVWNMYGPTETTIWSLVEKVEHSAERICIGQPIANTSVYVLDDDRRPVPIGVAGELYIGGEGLARGYWNRPDLTAERFIPNPFGSDGGRLYRTGDLVRYRPVEKLDAGKLEFLGRSDYQVKVRGYRVELGEIESVLLRHPSIRETVVVARAKAEESLLVAYVVPREGQSPALEDLRAFLKSELPEYMVPAAFVTLPLLPRNSSGKVDRKSLPEPGASRPELQVGFVAARNEMEKTIAAIWSEVLEVDQVGVRDNFFDLGGHSLRMVRVHSKLSQAVAAAPSLLQLFEYPTIESLAKVLMASPEETRHSSASDERQLEELKRGRDRVRARKARAGENQ